MLYKVFFICLLLALGQCVDGSSRAHTHAKHRARSKLLRSLRKSLQMHLADAENMEDIAATPIVSNHEPEVIGGKVSVESNLKVVHEDGRREFMDEEGEEQIAATALGGASEDTNNEEQIPATALRQVDSDARNTISSVLAQHAIAHSPVIAVGETRPQRGMHPVRVVDKLSDITVPFRESQVVHEIMSREKKLGLPPLIEEKLKKDEEIDLQGLIFKILFYLTFLLLTCFCSYSLSFPFPTLFSFEHLAITLIIEIAFQFRSINQKEIRRTANLAAEHSRRRGVGEESSRYHKKLPVEDWSSTVECTPGISTCAAIER